MAKIEMFFSGLIDSNQELRMLYDDNILDNDELLPHALMGDVTRYLMKLAILAATLKNGSEIELQRILDYFEGAFNDSNPQTQIDNLLAVSFLQNLEQPDSSYSIIKKRLGKKLKKNLRTIESFYSEARD